jgi:hypothetical protein
MRGRPWFRVLLVCLVFAVIGYPVWQLTGRTTVPPPPPERIAPPLATWPIRLDFTSGPRWFSLRQGDLILLEGGAPATTFHAQWTGPFPSEGVDFLFQAEWPDAHPAAAVRLQFTLPDGTVVTKTFWAEKKLTEIVTVLHP